MCLSNHIRFWSLILETFTFLPLPYSVWGFKPSPFWPTPPPPSSYSVLDSCLKPNHRSQGLQWSSVTEKTCRMSCQNHSVHSFITAHSLFSSLFGRREQGRVSITWFWTFYRLRGNLLKWNLLLILDLYLNFLAFCLYLVVKMISDNPITSVWINL